MSYPKVEQTIVEPFDPPKEQPMDGTYKVSIPRVRETRYSVRVNNSFVQRVDIRLGSGDWSWPAKSSICEEIIAEYLAIKSNGSQS